MVTTMNAKPDTSAGTPNANPDLTDLLLRNELDAARSRIASLQIELAQARDSVVESAAMQNELIKLKVELRELRASTSWRITSPLRYATTLVIAVRLAVQTVQRSIKTRGGIVGTFAYYAETVRREGIPGVRARLARLRTGAGFADGPPSDEVYHDWIERNDTITSKERERAQAIQAGFDRRPLISIVVPTYNSDERFLSEMIQSVRDQIYPNWELCIADDASPMPHVKRLLDLAAAEDSRIKVVFREANGHISEASNSALALASGEYVALLDHDDLLPPQALFIVARYINMHPGGRMFYSDEDKLTAEGKRTTPYFKSDWNPEMFLTQNMFSHLGVFETALIREAGGFRKGFEGSQDYDLAIRCMELVGHDKVVHIPHVLYHWRISPGSTAGSGSEKPYALIAAMRAVKEHLQRCGIAATVEQPFEHLATLRIRYALPSPAPRVSIIIPTRDGVDLLRQCIESVGENTIYPDYEIIVVDNGSEKDETLRYFEDIGQKPNIRILRDDSPFNFSALNNHAAAVATGEYLCLLNNDIEVISPDWLNEMVGLAAQPRNGAVGAALWYPNNMLQHGGVIIGLGGIAGHMHHMMKRGHFGYFGRAVATQNLSAVTAACLVIRKSIYDEVGGLDERLAVAFNDVDFCLRVREAGYRNVWTPYAQLYHHESATRGSDMDPDKYDRFVKEVRWMESRWAGKLDLDPAYNPNLSLSTQVLPFTLADPPRLPILD
ncbi:GT2 family glycosyltransferase [Paraburkholderia sp. BL6669N2]|uniref:glycosyltransferase n=1 Tax=Paraburkholderia sp. BL6669N2 TaxID=1938807 RepID=UPI000E2357D7|nr:glycosyltransferase [Paraburkholderia sp. BL6669N2]REG61250.1 GT2 family glycosyltransferase [Paraburkholderia sp. BL6669N2]